MTSLTKVRAISIDRKVLFVRGQRVMLDADLAILYGVKTKHLNQQVKRNPDRFPADFMFRLNASEKKEVVTNCDHLQKLKFSPGLPLAFTEHGALMLASVLNSSVATKVSIEVVRAFVHLREAITSHRDLSAKLDALERKYDRQFKGVFDAIRGLTSPPVSSRRIGFRTERS